MNLNPIFETNDHIYKTLHLNRNMHLPLQSTLRFGVEMSETAIQQIQPQNQRVKSVIRTTLAAWTISMSQFIFGYFLLYLIQIPTSTLSEIYGITLEQGVTQGILNGAVPIGALLGALSSSWTINNFSRRNNIFLANAVAIVFGCLIYVRNFPMLIICRFFQGFAVGILSSITPLMLREFSPNEMAGSLGSFTEFHISIGSLIGSFFPYILLKITGDLEAKAYWYYVFAFPQTIIVLQTILLIFVFPYQTPKYWLLLGQTQKAKRLIEQIYKTEYVEEVLQEKKKDILSVEQDDLEKQLQTVGHLKNIFQTGAFDATIERLQDEIQKMQPNRCISYFIAIFLAGFQQLSGVNVISVYSEIIGQQISTGQLQLLVPTLFGLCQCLAGVASYFLLDRFGRKSSLVFGLITSFVSLSIISAGYYIKDNHPYATTLILVFCFIFSINFGLTLGPAIWIYIADIAEPAIISLSMIIGWICGSFALVLFPILTKVYLNDNPAHIIVFTAALTFLALAIVYCLGIETQGKTEKEIKDEFHRIASCCRKEDETTEA